MAQQEHTQDPVMSQIDRSSGTYSLAGLVEAGRKDTTQTLDHTMNRAHVAGFRGDGEHNVVSETVYQSPPPQAQPQTEG